MKHPSLTILGRSEAAMLLGDTSRAEIRAVISIHGAREFGVEADVPRLDLAFDDVEVATGSDVMQLQKAMSRRRWSEQNGLIEVAPALADAAAIIEFAENMRDVGGIVLCHCGGGMSRAPAAALICLSVWRGPGSEAECVAGIRSLRRGAVPHIGLIRFADQLLNRDGKLVEALVGATH